MILTAFFMTSTFSATLTLQWMGLAASHLAACVPKRERDIFGHLLPKR